MRNQSLQPGGRQPRPAHGAVSESRRAMICQICTNETKVIYSKREAKSIRRRRECLCCRTRFYTKEVPEGQEQSPQDSEKELDKVKRSQRKAMQNLQESMTSVREIGRHLGMNEDG